MTAPRLRIYDLATGKTLIETSRGREIIAYRDEHRHPLSEWVLQYENPYGGWWDVPTRVRKEWERRSREAASA